MDLGSLVETMQQTAEAYHAAAPVIDAIRDTVAGAVNWYVETLKTHPFLLNLGQASVIMTTSDIAAQTMEKRAETGSLRDAIREINIDQVVYNLKLAPAYALGVMALIKSGEPIGHTIDSVPALKETLGSAGKGFTQSALGPNIWGAVYNAFLFFNNSVGRETGYSVGALARAYRNIGKGERSWVRNACVNIKERVAGKEYNQSIKGMVTFWNGIMGFGFWKFSGGAVTAWATPWIFPWTVFLQLQSGKKKKAMERKPPPTEAKTL